MLIVAIAYFEESPEVALGIINPADFRTRLQEHFDSDHAIEEDPAWYAMRNTVYAWGCRLEMSREHGVGVFAEAQSQAWRYFENALSVHTELIYSESGLLAVEALFAMVRFVVYGKELF
jgi:hypothetical protein